MMAPDPPLFLGEAKNNNNLLAAGASKAGGFWQEIVHDHKTTMAGDNG
jgi:hypothetical protein